MMRLDLATAEYIGARAQQQDLAAAVPLHDGAVLVLADGLGGHESGADASRIVIETFRNAGYAGRFDQQETRRNALRETVEHANNKIGEGVDPAHGHRGMASTAVAAVVADGEVSWVSVGDSHLYVWRAGRLAKLNEDHSQAGIMVKSGQYKPDDPEVQSVKSVLVSALTGRKLEIVDLPKRAFKIEDGDILILASDGLNTLEDAEIEGIVTDLHDEGAVRLSTVLLETVRARRVERQDNTTVAVAFVLSSPEEVAPETRVPTEVLGTERTVTHRVTVSTNVNEEPKTQRADVRPDPAVEHALASQPPSAEAALDPPVEAIPAEVVQEPPAVRSAPTPVSAEAAPALPAAASDKAAVERAPSPPADANPDRPRAVKGNGNGNGERPVPAAAAPSPRRNDPTSSAAPQNSAPPVDVARKPTPNLTPHITPKRRAAGWAFLYIILIWLAAAAAAVGSIAVMKPQWLEGWLPSALQPAGPVPTPPAGTATKAPGAPTPPATTKPGQSAPAPAATSQPAAATPKLKSEPKEATRNPASSAPATPPADATSAPERASEPANEPPATGSAPTAAPTTQPDPAAGQAAQPNGTPTEQAPVAPKPELKEPEQPATPPAGPNQQ